MIKFSYAKRVISGITSVGMLALFFLCSMPVAAENQTDAYTEISDAAGLMAVANAPEGNYRLTADIDLGESEWQPIPFSGKLDGAGHTLYNLHVTATGKDKRVTRDGNLKEYDTEFAGLFSVMENAEVKDLSLKGAFVDISGKGSCFAAILSGYSDGSTVSGCSVEGRVHMINNGVNAGVAGVAGYGTGVFEECKADVELVFEDRYTEGKCEQFLGGIMSCGIGDFKSCDVNINAYDSCHGYVHNGGIVGMFYRCGMKYSKRSITSCYVEGQISFFEDNKDRRAYCKPFGGEFLTAPKINSNNKHKLTINETKDYSKVLSPEACEKPDYETTVTPPDCTNWGYTKHTCRTCDYSWIDSYTPPQHDADKWVTVSESDYEHEGLKKQYCKKCGNLISEKTIPLKSADKEKDKKSTDNSNVTVWAIAASSGILLILEIAAIIYSHKRNKAAESEGTDSEKTDDNDEIS